MTRLFVTNLICILVVGVLFTAWFFYYTDLWPEIGGLLALGGILSWLAFISNVLSKNRIDQLQEWTDQHIFSNARSWKLCAALLAGGALCGSFRGTVQVKQVQGGSDRMVWTQWHGRFSDDAERLAPGEAIRDDAWTSCWSPRRQTVKVGGLPAAQVTLWPWERVALYIPSSFLPPVLLVRPSVRLMDTVLGTPMKLVVPVGNDKRETNFDGHPVWLGCDNDVDLPQRLRDSWRDELNAASSSSYMKYWLTPSVVPGGPLSLPPYSIVKLELQRAGTTRIVEEIKVIPFQRIEDFPQEAVLDVTQN